MVYAFMALAAALIVALDQITKYLTVANIAPQNANAETLAVLVNAFSLGGKDLSAQINAYKPQMQSCIDATMKALNKLK